MTVKKCISVDNLNIISNVITCVLLLFRGHNWLADVLLEGGVSASGGGEGEFIALPSG